MLKTIKKIFWVLYIIGSISEVEASTFSSPLKLLNFFGRKEHINDVRTDSDLTFPGTFEIHNVKFPQEQPPTGELIIGVSYVDTREIKSPEEFEQLLAELRKSPDGKYFAVKNQLRPVDLTQNTSSSKKQLFPSLSTSALAQFNAGNPSSSQALPEDQRSENSGTLADLDATLRENLEEAVSRVPLVDINGNPLQK